MADGLTKTTSASLADCRTYRVQEVPLKCGKTDLEGLLNQDSGRKRFKVKSLALEHHRRHQTATVDALDGGELPGYIDIPSDTSWDHDEGGIPLQTDDNFYGLTTLFTPPEEEHKVEYGNGMTEYVDPH